MNKNNKVTKQKSSVVMQKTIINLPESQMEELTDETLKAIVGGSSRGRIIKF